MLIYAHRGASARLPENTLASLAGAIADDADGVEVDLRATADGVPVLLHDRLLDRTTPRRGPVDTITFVELRALDPAGVVPTLAEALDLVGDRLRWDLEIKQPGIEAAVLAELRGRLGIEWFLSSFHPESLAAARALDATAPLWPLATACDDALLALAARLGAPGVAIAEEAFDETTAARLAGAGLSVALWTVNAVATARRVRALGAAILCTDDPAGIRRGLESDRTG